jgi:hypothetical protein
LSLHSYKSKKSSWTIKTTMRNRELHVLNTNRSFQRKHKHIQNKKKLGLHFLRVVWIVRRNMRHADVQAYRQHREGIIKRLKPKKIGILFSNISTYSFATLYKQFIFIWTYTSNSTASRMY